MTNLGAEHKVLRQVDRDKLISQSRILTRNAPDVGWAIRKHLDYVSTYTFQCRSGNTELDDKIESLMAWFCRPLNCDVSGRFSLQRLIRLAEQRAVTDGDCLIIKLSDGRIQLIEGDRVRNPTDLGEFTTADVDLSKFVQGVEVSSSGRPQRYLICDRTEIGGFRLAAVIQSQYVLHHGYFDRYDQIRGVSPIASAINTFCDVYESREYALAKAKLSQLFFLKMKLAGEPDAGAGDDPYTIDFNSAGPQMVQLSEGDDADFLESSTPSTEFQSFLQTGIQIGLKALDIPYSFFDEAYTNYSGARQSLLQYEQSCDDKRDRLRHILNSLTVWRLNLWIADGALEVPADFVMSDLDFEWIPASLPWIDPQREALGFEKMISLGLRSRQQISKENGLDWFTTADQLKVENDKLIEMGLASIAESTGTGTGTALDPSMVQQIADAVAEQIRGKN